ncbi:fas-associated death domain protein [Phlebotomus papatasi]|uniref:fas-associated death domain protein n=1 Tax=Phlebotomus papatasi TaxID=29031 RepID=UPI0024840C1F|nr:fas-associated death domain protein [Phlebotomus papatasi]
MSPHEERYKTVKSAFVRTLGSSKNLQEVKEIFSPEVSRRRLELIETPEDLIAILEAQCIIGEDTIYGFQKISDALDDPGLVCLTQNFRQNISQLPSASCPATPAINQYAALRKTQSLKTLENQSKAKPDKEDTENALQEKRDTIFKLISEEIGRKWMDFARGLKMRQGEIDAISDNHSSIPARVYIVLERVEVEKPRELFNLICQALQQSRRNDLQERVRKILLEQ